MSSFKPILILAAAAISGSVLGGQSASKATFQAYYDKYNASILKKDEPGVERMMNATHTMDFKSIDLKKKSSDLKSEIENMKKVMAIVGKFTKAATKVTKVVPGKKSATVTSATSMLCVTLKGGDGKTHTIQDENLSEDTWVSVDGKWKLKISKTIADKFYLDGKLTPQS